MYKKQYDTMCVHVYGCFVMVLNKHNAGLKLGGHSPGTSGSLELFL